MDMDAGARLAVGGNDRQRILCHLGGRSHGRYGRDGAAALGPGDFFGALALLGSVRRRATVTTEPARVDVAAP
jgi:hypothetical protein